MHEFNPVISTDENGDEYVDYQNGQLNQREQYHRGLAPQGFEIDDETGEHYIFDQEPDGPIDSNDEYMESIAEALPELPNALTYAQANLDPELMGHFYSAAEDGDYDNFHEILEIIMSEYDEHLESTGQLPIEEDEQLVEDEDSEEEELLEVPDISSLYQAEPDQDLSDEFWDLADKSEGATKLIYELSSRFHSNTGEDADSLIEQALSSGYSRDELIQAYNLING